MMTRRRLTLLASLAGFGALAACASSDATAPARATAARATTGASANSAPTGDQLHDGHLIPGALGSAGDAPAATGNRLACNVPSTLTDSAVIGASGGEIDFGPHRLIIPPGALAHDTLISGTIPAGPSITIELQPHGLHFNKPAGLQFDVSGCGEIEGAIYLDGLDGPEHIPAVFSEWWHTVAAPLDHFSGYALDM